MNQPLNTSGARDSVELEALFDSVSGQFSRTASAMAAGGKDQTFTRVGQMMRQLNDTLRELGYDTLIKNTVHHAIPDTRDRLAYIANLTEQAACRVLNATDAALPLQDELQSSARDLGGRWRDLYASRLTVDEFKRLAGDTVAYLERQVPEQTEASKAHLMEIMMAQDFQDLTGQVIKKIVALAQDLEKQLMTVLVDLIPEERKSAVVTGLLNGPVVSADTAGDTVASQQQVDDLLDSLGF